MSNFSSSLPGGQDIFDVQSPSQNTQETQGVIFIHSCPEALCPHVEWAISSVLDEKVDIQWERQPASPGMFRGEISWKSHAGKGALLASALRGWAHLRYEITEEPSPGVDGSRWSHTPELGIFHATTDVAGNIVISEDRLRYAYEQAAGDPGMIHHELSLALGEAWDEELDPFRYAQEASNVRWLQS